MKLSIGLGSLGLAVALHGLVWAARPPTTESLADDPSVPAPQVAQAPPGPTDAPPAVVTPPPPAAASGPVIVMPPEEPPAAKSAPGQVEPEPEPPPVPRGIDPQLASNQAFATNLGAGRRIPIGAYGEAMMLSMEKETQLTLRRVVLFFGYQFSDWASVYSELEVENVSEFEIEQSYLEFKPFKKLKLGLRVGLILIPLGIINLYHEPPTFNGVDRPQVDQLILPSTWRELGAGVFGTILTGLHYQVVAVAGSDGSKFTAGGAIGPGLARGFTLNTQNWALAGRLNFNRILGLDVAAGFYYGTANQKDVNLQGIQVGLIEADARFTRWGLSLRAEYARIFINGADKITQLIRATSPTASAVGSAAQGFYAEAGYNLLHALVRTEQQVVVFGRYEYVDTRAELPNVTDPGHTEALQFLTAGLTYRPKLELAIKFDYRRTLAGYDTTDADGSHRYSLGSNRYSLGVAFMY
jgi:hypothetical protein